MKSIRRRLAAAVLSLAVVLSMMPAAAFTAWADEGEKDIVAEETSNETVSNDQDGDLQPEGEEAPSPESKKTMKAAVDIDDESKASISLGSDIELKSLVVGYSSTDAAANIGEIKLENTGNTPVTIYPDKLSLNYTKFVWTKTIDEPVTLEPNAEPITVATVVPKVGLAADWYYGYVYYRDYDQGLYSSTMVYLAILKDGLSLDVYDDNDKDITLFDLGSSIVGSTKTVSQDFWVTNDGNKDFSLSFSSTNPLFQVEQKTGPQMIGSDEDVLCNIKVDPERLGNLTVGTYTGNVTARATDNNGKVAEETIPVTYSVTERPKWATSEASETIEVGSYAYSTKLYIDNISAFKNEEEDYLKATLIEGDADFTMSKYIYSDGYTYIQSNDLTPDEGIYTAKIRLLYDPTGQGTFNDPVDLGTMDYTLRVVPEGTYQLSLVNEKYDKDKEVLDLGVLYTGYTEKDAENLGTTLRFKNTGIGDLDVSGKGFGAYYSENGEDFIWTEGTEAVTLKPLEEYDEISIRPQTGKKPGVYYDYFYIQDDNNICYTEFQVRYLVADKGQTMRVVDSGGLFDSANEIENGDPIVYNSSYINADGKQYYKWIDIYNTGKAPFWLSMPSTDTCNGAYSFSYLDATPVKVDPGKSKMLRIILDTNQIPDRGQAGIYEGKFKISISDKESGEGDNTQTRTIPVSYTITDKTYHVSLDLQGKGVYEKNKVEADFPEGTTYKSAIAQLNKEIVGDTSNLWPVDNEYTVVAFTKNKDNTYSSWDELIEAQKQVSDQPITEDTDLYVNWAKKILTADVTAEIPAGGTTAGTAIKASVDKDAPYSIYEVSWKDMNDKDVLECNDAYPLEVKLDANFGYAFSVDSSIRINGVYATRTSASNTVSHATANRRVMIDHDWDEGKVTKEATADSEGVKTITCRHCKETKTEAIPKVDISNGTKHSTSAGTVRIVSEKNKTAAFVKPSSNKKKVTVPATVNVGGKTFKITAIDARAFKGKKTTTLIVKTKKLTKKSVKGSLKGSKIKTVKVKVGKKKVNKKYVKKYRKIFTKKNAGKKVKVK